MKLTFFQSVASPCGELKSLVWNPLVVHYGGLHLHYFDAVVNNFVITKKLVFLVHFTVMFMFANVSDGRAGCGGVRRGVAGRGRV